MINFMNACQIAKEKLVSEGYMEGFVDVRENSEKWFFSGRFENNNKTEYGNLPVAVDKENGKCEMFMMFAPDNLFVVDEATPVDVPEDFELLRV